MEACIGTENATIAILPVTKICGAPGLHLPDLSFFADMTMVIKNYMHPSFIPAQYIHQCIYTNSHSCELH